MGARAGWALGLSGGGGGVQALGTVSSGAKPIVCGPSFPLDGTWNLTKEALGTCWLHLLIG